MAIDGNKNDTANKNTIVIDNKNQIVENDHHDLAWEVNSASEIDTNYDDLSRYQSKINSELYDIGQLK